MRFTRRQNVQGTAAEFHLRMLREVKDTLECMKSSSRRFCVYKENFGREVGLNQKYQLTYSWLNIDTYQVA